MPTLTIEISEQVEAQIVDAIRRQRDFYIDGGRVAFGDEPPADLRKILFQFKPHPPVPAAGEQSSDGASHGNR